MKSITLISDTHSHLDEGILVHCKDADEIWHGGDLGDHSLIEKLSSFKGELKGVYGNIDTADVRYDWPLNQIFECEGIKVLMTHIGGYPGKYTKRVHDLLIKERPNLYICGHSHICKVVPDRELDLLHMNPGACGHHGFHSMRTILKFEIDQGEIKNLNVVELGIRGYLG